MEYITIKRFKRAGIGGQFNIPYGKPLTKSGDLLYCGDLPVCVSRSAAAHEYFARNDDGQGQLRGKLSHDIIKALGGFSVEEKDCWKRVWEDELAQRYRRPEHKDYWLWNDDFFNAPIADLEYLAALVKGDDHVQNH